jgi:hypothetical protein
MLTVFCQAVFFRDEKVEPTGMYSWRAWQKTVSIGSPQNLKNTETKTLRQPPWTYLWRALEKHL